MGIVDLRVLLAAAGRRQFQEGDGVMAGIDDPVLWDAHGCVGVDLAHVIVLRVAGETISITMTGKRLSLADTSPKDLSKMLMSGSQW